MRASFPAIKVLKSNFDQFSFFQFVGMPPKQTLQVIDYLEKDEKILKNAQVNVL
jgi:hypothetical protein